MGEWFTMWTCRWWTKVRLCKIYVDVDRICDRCRQYPATYFHMLWACSSLNTFRTSVSFTPFFTALLGVILVPAMTRTWYSFCNPLSWTSHSYGGEIPDSTNLSCMDKGHFLLYQHRENPLHTEGIVCLFQENIGPIFCIHK